MGSTTSKILIVSASEKEVNIFTQKVSNLHKTGQWLSTCNFENIETDILISGMGLPLTIYRLSTLLSKEKYDLVINPGIAGSFRNDLPIGTVVYTAVEQFGDLGVDDNGEILTLFDLGYIDPGINPFTGGKLLNSYNIEKYRTLVPLPRVNGITVNMASGNMDEIERRRLKFSPDIETMEGAGVFFVCLLQNIPFIEIRSISNLVEPRNAKNWNVPMALINLGDILSKLFSEINQQEH
jgi:futalosine hydrolase